MRVSVTAQISYKDLPQRQFIVTSAFIVHVN